MAKIIAEVGTTPEIITGNNAVASGSTTTYLALNQSEGSTLNGASETITINKKSDVYIHYTGSVYWSATVTATIKLYRDSTLIDSFQITSDSAISDKIYKDEDVDPGTYTYQVKGEATSGSQNDGPTTIGIIAVSK